MGCLLIICASVCVLYFKELKLFLAHLENKGMPRLYRDTFLSMFAYTPPTPLS